MAQLEDYFLIAGKLLPRYFITYTANNILSAILLSIFLALIFITIQLPITAARLAGCLVCWNIPRQTPKMRQFLCIHETIWRIIEALFNFCIAMLFAFVIVMLNMLQFFPLFLTMPLLCAFLLGVLLHFNRDFHFKPKVTIRSRSVVDDENSHSPTPVDSPIPSSVQRNSLDSVVEMQQWKENSGSPSGKRSNSFDLSVRAIIDDSKEREFYLDRWTVHTIVDNVNQSIQTYFERVQKGTKKRFGVFVIGAIAIACVSLAVPLMSCNFCVAYYPIETSTSFTRRIINPNRYCRMFSDYLKNSFPLQK